MWGKFLFCVAVFYLCYPHNDQNDQRMRVASHLLENSIFYKALAVPEQSIGNQQSLLTWLQKPQFHLNPAAIKVMCAAIAYAEVNHVAHNNIVTLIDYALPADQKRLWVFDLNTHHMLFHTYVSHGLKSGTLESHYFSNQYNSKASSIGVYRTDKVYYGRHGLSLKLEGIDPGFNDNAESRAIVMHGGWYTDEDFIKKYGRAGRSWGCPAVPEPLTKAIIDQIKENALFIAYYPSHAWFLKSKFLKDDTTLVSSVTPQSGSFIQGIHFSERRADILLARLEKKNKFHETEAILVMPSQRYELLFQIRPPLNRMLRRQIAQEEYIALSPTELKQLAMQSQLIPNLWEDIYFVVPQIVMVRGYYATEMHKMDMGKIKTVHTPDTELGTDYSIDLENNQSIVLRSSHQFIRWLGL